MIYRTYKSNPETGPRSQRHRGVACGMTGDIDCHRQSGDMGRICLHRRPKSRSTAAEPRRADAGFVYRIKNALLKLSVLLAMRAHRSDKCFFCKHRTIVEAAADTHAHDNGRARVAPGSLTVSATKSIISCSLAVGLTS